MAFSIKTFGPFSLNQRDGSVDINDFLDRINNEKQDLAKANGIYIFSQPHASGSIPWYVGRTRNTFEARFKSHFRNEKMKEASEQTRKVVKRIQKQTSFDVELEVILIAFLTGRKGAAAGLTDSRKKWINFLETSLIGACLRINPKLQNAQDTHLFRKVPVPGFLDHGLPRDKAADSLAAMLEPRRTA